MREFNIEKDFFDSIRDLKPQNHPALKIYEDLLISRFEDVISSCFPIYKSMISEKKFLSLTKLFMQSNPRNPFIWKSPQEFFSFVQKKRLFTKKTELEILDFELEELKLFLNQKETKVKQFNKKRRIRLSKTAKIKKLSINLDLTKKKCFYILYQNPEDFQVYHFETTEYIYNLVKLLQTNSVERALKLASKQGRLKLKNSRPIFLEGLEHLCKIGVLH